jgi:type I restriction enzyme S subunit
MEERRLPVGWEVAEIGDLCELKNGRAFKAQEWKEEGLPIVRIQNLNKRDAPYNYFQGEVEDRFRLRGGELLFAWSGTPGTSFGAHIWNGADAVLNQHIFRVDFDKRLIDIDFFRYAINQKLDDLIDTAHGGVGLRHVTKGKFEKTAVSLPPQAEQRRIAAKLDTTLAAVDACRQRLDGVEALLKRFRQAVLAAATSGELTREWREERNIDAPEVVTLGDIIKVSSGKFMPAKAMDPSGKIPVYGGNGIAGYHSESNVDAATVVIGRVGYYCGSVHLTPEKAWVTDNALIVKIKHLETNRDFLYYALIGTNLRSNDSSTAQPVISGAKIYPVPFLLPSFDEQCEIVARIEALFSFADQLEAKLTSARQIVERLTPALLAKAFRGELVPQDPNDEPASVLLKRIRAARQAEAAAAIPSRRGRWKAASNPATSTVVAAPVTPDLLASLLRECGALSEKALLAASELDTRSFDRQLEFELKQGRVRRVDDDGQLLVEAAD